MILNPKFYKLKTTTLTSMKKRNLALIVLVLLILSFGCKIQDQTEITLKIPPSSDCPEGFILATNDVSFITKDNVCKPALMKLTTSEDSNDYLSDKLPGMERIWDNWKDYQPLVNKVNELTAGKTNDFEKVEAIANWVHKSKDYACETFPPPPRLEGCLFTPAYNDEDFSIIFDSNEGVCLDAAIITSVMLRAAGIPSILRMVSIYHIVTMYYIDGLWYSIDTSFCFDKTNCPDLNFMSSNDANQRIYFIYNRIGHFNEEGLWNVEGRYCENDFCMEHPFQTNKIMPLNDKSEEATVIYPSIRNTIVERNQIFCSLEFKNMICDPAGCFFSDVYGDKWNTVIKIQHEIEDMINIGYNEVKLPAKIKFLVSETGGKKTINYRFACKQHSPDYRLIAYKEFVLLPNEKLVITYEDIIKSEEATNEEFNIIKNTIKSTTFDLGIISE